MQKDLLEQGNTKDYYVLESVLKGNFLLKSNWKQDLIQGKENRDNKVNMDNIKEIASFKKSEAPPIGGQPLPPMQPPMPPANLGAMANMGAGDDVEEASKLNRSLQQKPMQEHNDFNNVYSAGINFGTL
mmetsp:Transcript_5116/g.7804  ORF Transcript_5116/g.7804 Transcript_5116/m.7804 type:complete len:129 (+) Transcript_5116:3212-3598(+)